MLPEENGLLDSDGWKTAVGSPDRLTLRSASDEAALAARLRKELPQWLKGVLAAWVVTIAMVLGWIASHAVDQGSRGSVPAELPVLIEDEFEVPAELHTDLACSSAALSSTKVDGSEVAAHLFIHPKCPCSAASVVELERLAVRLSARNSALSSGAAPVQITAHVYQPADALRDWRDNAIIAHLRRIAGVTIHFDIEGRTSSRFGIRNSGHLLVYVDGQIQFSGGLTETRGHVGLGTSGEAAYQVISNQVAAIPVECAVFGCSITAKVCLSDAFLPKGMR